MHTHRWTTIIALLVVLAALGRPAQAQGGPVVADRDNLQIVGTLGGGALSGSLVLTASQDVGDLALLASDLVDSSGAAAPHDPIPASAVSIVPAARWPQLKAGDSVQVALLVAPPATSGSWAGTLTVRWRQPASGELHVPVTLTARNRPVLSLAGPPSLRVSASRGETLVRRLLLQETGNGLPDTGLRLVMQDLTDAQGNAVLPASHLTAQLPANQVAGGGFLNVDLSLDLQGVPAGDYRGNLVLTDDYHNRLFIPLQVTVKDNWPWPLALLVLGLVLGLGLTAYRAVGHPRDRLQARIAALRRQLNQETQHPAQVREAVEPPLAEAEAALADERWEDCVQAVQRAEARLNRWRNYGAGWTRQLDAIRELKQRLESIAPPAGQSATVRQLRLQLDQLHLADFETVEAAQAHVAALAARLQRFEQLQERLLALKGRLDQALGQNQLPQPVVADWQAQLDDLAHRLESLAPDSDADAQILGGDLVKAGRRLAADLERHAQLDARKSGCLAAAQDMKAELGHRGSPTADIARAANQARDSVNQQEDWAIGADWAENIWRGLWSAHAILPLAGEAPPEAAGALHTWLADASNYLQRNSDFRAALHEREQALQNALAGGGQAISWPSEPPPPAGPALESMLADLAQLETDLVLASPPAVPPGQQALQLLGGVGGWLRGQVARSQVRLTLFSVVAYLALVIALSWLGFNQLYLASSTFGANLVADYFGLLVWGVGVDLITRSAVMDTLKEMLANS
jgi:hypothetical protein